jgi:hypothetical protein
MRKITVELNQALFTVYVGLTKSGYDLADKNDKDIVGLCRRVREMDCHQEILNYFAFAKSNCNRLNPYWPRGSILAAASLFISSTKFPEYETFNDFLQFERSVTNFSREELNDDVIGWLRELPVYIDLITGNDAFPAIWAEYQKIIYSRLENYNKILEKADKTIQDFYMGTLPEKQNIIFSPNLLQSPFIADFITKKGTLVVIKTFPDMLSILHEFLHSEIKPFRGYFTEFIRVHNVDIIGNYSKLSASGYMWNKSEESFINILEESFVRGLSVAMTVNASKSESIDAYINSDVNSGFILVHAITRNAVDKTPNHTDLENFITGMLDSLSSKPE